MQVWFSEKSVDVLRRQTDYSKEFLVLSLFLNPVSVKEPQTFGVGWYPWAKVAKHVFQIDGINVACLMPKDQVDEEQLYFVAAMSECSLLVGYPNNEDMLCLLKFGEKPIGASSSVFVDIPDESLL